MVEFNREFRVEALTPGVLTENAWFCDLLSRWRPPGEAAHGPSIGPENEHLRLAVRNGYLNFYRAGRSIARVCFKRGNLQAEIHNKYVRSGGASHDYITLTSRGFSDPATKELVPYARAHLREWMLNANCHPGGDEKRFVDLVVAHNLNIVDLEVGLPAYSEIPEERRAPRMDLVAIEPIGNQWRVVFWEAKLVDDGRARSSGSAVLQETPRVLRQLADYTVWLGHGTHKHLVARVYQSNCRLLVRLHAIAKRFQPGINELGPGIQAIAASGAPLPLIDQNPRLIIDALPDREGKDRKGYDAFVKNGHLKKLRDDCGLHVQVVGDRSQMVLETRH